QAVKASEPAETDRVPAALVPCAVGAYAVRRDKATLRQLGDFMSGAAEPAVQDAKGPSTRMRCNRVVSAARRMPAGVCPSTWLLEPTSCLSTACVTGTALQPRRGGSDGAHV